MGWQSTVQLTREQAIDRLEILIKGALDEDLADALEAIQGGARDRCGDNYQIVSAAEMAATLAENRAIGALYRETSAACQMADGAKKNESE